jgi:2-amino-4-hydroxy-6-hydroxymethyldihydropteridine diphosphokinase
VSGATACIALGSNLGDRRGLLESAYLNAAAILRCRLEPRALLDEMLAIEASHGRDRRREERWGPRRLDLDLLLYEDLVLDEPGLTVPHPRLHERSFALGPLAQIAAQTVHPVLGLTIEQLRDRLSGAGGV